MAKVQLLTDALFQKVKDLATLSPRRRMNYNFHQSAEENPHRFLNVLLKGTYVRPHRHLTPPKAESFLILEGVIEVFLFDDAGVVTDRYCLGLDSGEGKLWGIDLAAGVWHTVRALTDTAVCFEVKPGPWDPASDKQFAPWAPAETDPAAVEYQQRLATETGANWLQQ